MLNSMQLAIRFLRREWRSGEWSIVFFALFLAIAAITSINFYTDRVLRGIDLQSAKFLGGDLVISSSSPIMDKWINKANARQLKTAEVWLYQSVVNAKNKLQLVDIQAVDKHFPLLGEQAVSIESGTVWVESRLLPLLGISLNDVIRIGVKEFRVSKILTSDSLLNAKWSIAPNVLMSLEDVLATRTVIPGSRVDYRLLIAGDPSQIKNYKQWITTQLGPEQVLLDIHNQQLALQNILQRTYNYLQLALLVCLMMSGVAITLNAQQYMRKHYAAVALWRCFGVKKSQVRQILLWQLFIIALSAGVIAIGAGYITQNIFANLFKNYLQFPLPPTSIKPAIFALITSFFLLFAMTLPMIIELPQHSPLAIWRNELGNHWRKNTLYLILILSLLLIIYWFMNATELTLFILGSLSVSVFILYLISRLILVFFQYIRMFAQGVVRQGLGQLVHYANSVSLQFIGFNLIIIVLLILGLVRSDFIQAWKYSLPKKTPNYFAINIAPADIQQLKYFFQQHQIVIEGMYPMVRGRLIELNNKPIFTVVPKSALNNNALHRDLNLSWMWQLPSDNKIVNGSMWSINDESQSIVSVEKKLADDLQLHLGDQLTFQVGGMSLTATIVNFRTLDWSSFHPNFYMIFPPGFLKNAAITYITSFHLSTEETILLNQLVELFPNMTIIDVSNLLQQVQDLLSKIIIAMQYLFLFALAIGVLVFVASLQATMDERRKTYHLLHILGASKNYIRKSIIVEFTCFFLIIMVTSSAVAYFILLLLKQYFLYN